MKLAVAGLMLLGLVAALCAAILVGAMKGSPQPITIIKPPAVTNDQGEVKVLVAARALPAMTQVEASDVKIATMPREKAPTGFVTTPVEVIGKVLAAPLGEGAAFVDTQFSGQIGTRISAVIPPGKRAVGISVADYAGLDGLLYPGAMVDVLISLRPETGGTDNTHHDALATTLLENVPVLAIEQMSVVSVAKPDDHNEPSRGTHRITLLVDTRQAKALDLGMQQGTLSLTMRNPTDDGPGERDALSEGAMVNGAPVRAGASNAHPLTDLENVFAGMMNRKPAPVAEVTPVISTTTQPTEQQPQDSQIEVEIIRPAGVEKRVFIIPVADHQETATTNDNPQ